MPFPSGILGFPGKLSDYFKTRIFNMEDSIKYIRKHSRAHKYLCAVPKKKVEEIISKNAMDLDKISIFRTKLAPAEVHDEYDEMREQIISNTRSQLQDEFKKKFKTTHGTPIDTALKIYLNDS